MAQISTTKDRILLFIKEKELNVSKFEKLVGFSNGYIHNVRGKFSDVKLEQILNKFPELSRDWLYAGTGSMFNSEVASPIPPYGLKKESLLKMIGELTEAELINAKTQERNSKSLAQLIKMLESTID